MLSNGAEIVSLENRQSIQGNLSGRLKHKESRASWLCTGFLSLIGLYFALYLVWSRHIYQIQQLENRDHFCFSFCSYQNKFGIIFVWHRTQLNPTLDWHKLCSLSADH